MRTRWFCAGFVCCVGVLYVSGYRYAWRLLTHGT